MYKILVVEDDDALCTNVIKSLSAWNYEMYRIKDFSKLFDEFLEIKPHLVLMDVNLPFFDGFYWCKKIREKAKTPIIFLSSRDSEMDIVMAITQGADDYVTKPFIFNVLLSKIQAILRRSYDYQNEWRDTIEYKGVVLDIASCVVTYEDKSLELTKNEHKILGLLMKNKTKVVSRQKLMKELWEDDCFVNENTLTVNINRIRAKLEEIEIKEFITTKKGEGYIVL